MFRSGNMIVTGTQCCIVIAESLHFKTVKLRGYGGDNAQDDTAIPLPKTRILENLDMRLPEPDYIPNIFYSIVGVYGPSFSHVTEPSFDVYSTFL